MRTGALDAGAGDVMGVAGQAVLNEQRAARVDHAPIEDVDILDVDPGADAVVAEVAALRRERADQMVEDLEGLRRRR